MRKVILVILSIIFSVKSYSADFSIFSESSYRLPNNTYPQNYAINLTFNDILNTQFSGIVDIHIKVIEDTDEIILHGSNIQVNYIFISYTCDFTKNRFDGSFSFDEKNEFLKIKFNESDIIFKASQDIFLRISYFGEINTRYQGFYHGSYMNMDPERERFD